VYLYRRFKMLSYGNPEVLPAGSQILERAEGPDGNIWYEAPKGKIIWMINK
jgi:hypothetical protein